MLSPCCVPHKPVTLKKKKKKKKKNREHRLIKGGGKKRPQKKTPVNFDNSDIMREDVRTECE
jgi:hypothetical protein